MPVTNNVIHEHLLILNLCLILGKVNGSKRNMIWSFPQENQSLPKKYKNKDLNWAEFTTQRERGTSYCFRQLYEGGQVEASVLKDENQLSMQDLWQTGRYLSGEEVPLAKGTAEKQTSRCAESGKNWQWVLQESVQLGKVEPDYRPDLQHVQNCTWKKCQVQLGWNKQTNKPTLMVLCSLS